MFKYILGIAIAALAIAILVLALAPQAETLTNQFCRIAPTFGLGECHPTWSSSPGVSHLQALTQPNVTVSGHSAPIVQPSRSGSKASEQRAEAVDGQAAEDMPLLSSPLRLR